MSLDNMKAVTDKYMKSLEPKRKLKLPVIPDNLKASLASFASSIKQEKVVPELTEMLTKALAEKAVVEENGKVLEGFQVRRTLLPTPLAKRQT